MSELDDDVQRRLVDAYRSKGPSAGERERVFAALTTAIASGAAAPAAAASQGVFKAFVLSHPIALSVVGLGVGCTVALGVWLTRAPAPPQASALCAVPCAAVRPAPSIALPEAPPEAPAASEAPAPPTSPAPEVDGGSATTSRPSTWKRPAPHGDELAAEAALLHRAHSAYRRGQPAETLALLREHAAKYPSTQLSVERGTLKVLALCALNRIDEARRIAATLPPRSTALRGACVER
jgi:hypothetical protein